MNELIHIPFSILMDLKKRPFIGLLYIDMQKQEVMMDEAMQSLVGSSIKVLPISDFWQLPALTATPNVFKQIIEGLCSDPNDTAEIIHYVKTNTGYRYTIQGRSQWSEMGCEYMYIWVNKEEHNKAEQQLAVLEAAFDNAPEGVAFVELSGRFFKVNQSMSQMLGFPKEELYKKYLIEFVQEHDVAELKAVFKQFVEGKIDKFTSEKQYIHKKGQFIWTVLSVAIVKDAYQKPVHFVIQIVDRTALYQSKTRIASLLAKTKDQNKRLLNFAHIVSHNLRSHSGNLWMLKGIILEEHPELSQSESFSYLTQSVDKLQETIDYLNEVLLIYKNESENGIELQLSNFIDKTALLFKRQLKDIGGILQYNIAETIYVKQVPAYLESILLNLISNAIKYRSLERPLVLELRVQETKNDTILSCSDNGLGIDLNLHGKQLFGMYKTFHHHAEARGVGLFLMRNQVEALNGRIEVESEVGQGTTFRIYFKK